MEMKVAFDPIEGDEIRQSAFGGCLDLSRVLAKWWRNERKVERLVNGLLGRRGDQFLTLEQPVLVEQPSPIDRPLSQGYVVRLRPGEVDQRRPVLVGGDDPHVDLHPGVGQISMSWSSRTRRPLWPTGGRRRLS